MIDVVALLMMCAAPNVDAASIVVPPGSAASDEAPAFEGWATATEGYRLRTDGSASDNDAIATFGGGASAFAGKLGFDFSGALFYDIDGTGTLPHSAVAFPSVHDAYGPFAFLVDNLEVRYAQQPWLPRLSAGRLTVDEGLPLLLDGVAVRVTPLFVADTAWSLFASAGRTVHYFTYDDASREDWTGSIGGDAVISRRVKIEVDWRALIEDSPSHRYQTAYGATYDQRFDDVALARLWARGVNDELAYVGARAHLATPLQADGARASWLAPWWPSSLQIGVDAQGIEQTATLGEVFEEENPFYAVLGPSEPNLRGAADAWASYDAGFATTALHAGAAGRTVLRGAPGPFNRDFARVYASVDADDVVVKGPFLSVIASYDAAVPRADGKRFFGIDPAVVAFGGSAGWRGDLLRAAVGTSWDRTKYTYYQDVVELTDVRTVFASLELRPLALVHVRGDYTLEIADRVVHTFTVSLSENLDGAL